MSDREGGFAPRRIADVLPRDRVAISGIVVESSTRRFGGTPSYLVVVDDGTGEIGALFLGRAAVVGLANRTRCGLRGTAGIKAGRLVLLNPFYHLELPDEE